MKACGQFLLLLKPLPPYTALSFTMFPYCVKKWAHIARMIFIRDKQKMKSQHSITTYVPFINGYLEVCTQNFPGIKGIMLIRHHANSPVFHNACAIISR